LGADFLEEEEGFFPPLENVGYTAPPLFFGAGRAEEDFAPVFFFGLGGCPKGLLDLMGFILVVSGNTNRLLIYIKVIIAK